MTCPFCNSKNINDASFPRPTRFNNKLFSYRECRDCALIFIDPIPDVEDYNAMYSNQYHEQFYFKKEVIDYSPIRDAVDKFILDKVIVDYGCGDGSFLRFFQKSGYSCIGVEYDKELVEKLKVQNPQISFLTVDEFWSKNDLKFSVIFFGDVLEHIAKPAEFLRSVNKKLPENGFLVAQGPLENNSNLGHYFRKMTSSFTTKENKIVTNTPYHITFTTAKNQEELFKNTGFETMLYKINETPWPFPAHFSPQPVKAIQFFVGQASVFISKIVPAKMGNRFLYVGRKNATTDQV